MMSRMDIYMVASEVEVEVVKAKAEVESIKVPIQALCTVPVCKVEEEALVEDLVFMPTAC